MFLCSYLAGFLFRPGEYQYIELNKNVYVKLLIQMSSFDVYREFKQEAI